MSSRGLSSRLLVSADFAGWFPGRASTPTPLFHSGLVCRSGLQEPVFRPRFPGAFQTLPRPRRPLARLFRPGGNFSLHCPGFGQKILVDTTIHSDSTLFTGLLQPLFSALPRCRHSRSCPSLSDPDWLALGTLRVLLDHGSGRGFLQHMLAHCRQTPSTSLFFENLGSPRRLRLCSEASDLLRRQASAELPDAFAAHTLLENFDIFAGDGSYLVAACHDRPQPSSSAASGHKKFATGHFFGMDLRTSALFHLAVADQIERRLKKLDPEVLRQGAPKGRKVLWAWDRAITDFRLWHNLKTSHGIYFITRQKENFAGEPSGNHTFDASAPINQGVLSDEMVGSGGGGVAIRRITFLDPLTGVVHVLLTNEMTLPPGLLALIYKMRWDIEKAFDQIKNKCGEKKSWASSPQAKSMQAHFICMAHNLMLLQEHKLAVEHQITDTAETKRKTRRLEKERKVVLDKGMKLPPALQSLQRVTQRGIKFIRWLRMFLFSPAPWCHMLATLRTLYQRH